MVEGVSGGDGRGQVYGVCMGEGHIDLSGKVARRD